MTGEPDFRTVLAELTESGVRFVLIGGLAMVAHGSAHITGDLDIGYARDRANIEAVVRALSPLNPRLRGFPPELPFVWDVSSARAAANQTLLTDAADVDILGEIPGIDSFEGLWSRSVETELFGIKVRIAGLDDLIAMKQAAGRLKDQTHIMELLALKKLIEEESR